MRLAALLLASLMIAGCGSQATGEAEQPAKKRFAVTCGTCHTLADAGTSGTFGPDLDDLRPERARVLAAIEAGPGSMPAGLLEGAEAEALAGYVASVAGR